MDEFPAAGRTRQDARQAGVDEWDRVRGDGYGGSSAIADRDGVFAKLRLTSPET